jgi:hypothetical protein
MSKSILWSMAAMFLGLAVLLGGGLYLASHMVNTVSVASVPSVDTIRTPAGSFRLERQGETGPGLPVYPNSALMMPSEKNAALALEERKHGINTVHYLSRDARDSVDQWYTQHLGQEFARHDAGERSLPPVFRDVHVSDTDIAFVAERGRQVRIVTLALDPLGTAISLLRFEKPVTE